MSGQVWNHLPEMLEHFEEEGIAFPTFSDEEMADLIAYLHGGATGGTDTSPSNGNRHRDADGDRLALSSHGVKPPHG